MGRVRDSGSGARWSGGSGHLRSLLQITYSAINDELRDKLRFPTVLRTVAGASHHIEAMVQLMLRFHWNWIVVLVSDDNYGRSNSQMLNERLASSDICIAFQEVLPAPQTNQVVTPQEREHLQIIVDKLQESSARVVVLFSPDLALHNFFGEVLRRNFTRVVWIASESWAIDPVLHNFTELRHTGTFLGITTQSVLIPGFDEFRLHHSRGRKPASNTTRLKATCNQECDTCLDTTMSFGTDFTFPGEFMVYNVYSAVYAVAHALHRLLGCSQTNCSRSVIYPWQVRQDSAPGSRQSVVSTETTPPTPIGGFWANRERPWDVPCLQAHRSRSPSWCQNK